MRRCSACDTDKPIEDFYEHKDQRPRFVCRTCHSAQHQAYYAANTERVAAQQKEYRERNQEAVAAQQQRWHDANRERDREGQNRRRAEPGAREVRNAAERAAYHSDIDEARRKQRERAAARRTRRGEARTPEQKARRRAKREAENAAERRRYAANIERERERIREKDRARRVGKDPQAIEYAEVIRGDPCSYCGGGGGAVDHIDSVLRGGANAWDNLTAACTSCNSRKNARSLLQALLIRPAVT